MDKHILIVGAGDIASAYAAVLADLELPYEVCCVSEASARGFAARHNVPCHAGGLEAFCASGAADRFSHAILALPIPTLPAATKQLLAAGVEQLLIEKPAGLDHAVVRELADSVGVEAARHRCHIAYNRRYFASIIAARQAIAEDGGATSFSFEFTELSDRLRTADIPADLLRHWEYANSTHVIDTAFHLAGVPEKLWSIKSGSLDFHPDAARYAGAGVTGDGVPFTYLADWDAPGRWGIEINTRYRKLILRPMERLGVQARNSFEIVPMTIDDDLDRRFKPGFYRQTQAFLQGLDNAHLLSLQAQADQLGLFARTIFKGAD